MGGRERGSRLPALFDAIRFFESLVRGALAHGRAPSGSPRQGATVAGVAFGVKGALATQSPLPVCRAEPAIYPNHKGLSGHESPRARCAFPGYSPAGRDRQSMPTTRVCKGRTFGAMRFVSLRFDCTLYEI